MWITVIYTCTQSSTACKVSWKCQVHLMLVNRNRQNDISSNDKILDGHSGNFFLLSIYPISINGTFSKRARCLKILQLSDEKRAGSSGECHFLQIFIAHFVFSTNLILINHKGKVQNKKKWNMFQFGRTPPPHPSNDFFFVTKKKKNWLYRPCFI